MPNVDKEHTTHHYCSVHTDPTKAGCCCEPKDDCHYDLPPEKVINNNIKKLEKKLEDLESTNNQKEQLRIKLISWIAELITEWDRRTEEEDTDLKTVDRSDLIIDLANKIDKFYA